MRIELPGRTEAARRRLLLSLELLLDRRTGLFLTLEGFLLLFIFVTAVASGKPGDLYVGALIPLLVPGVLMLSDTVALERRAGSLDLALSSPGAGFYFEKRALSMVALLVVQGCVILVLERLLVAQFTLMRSLLQMAVSGALVGAVVLFWSVRVRGPDAVIFGALLTLGLLSPWFFHVPALKPEFGSDLDSALAWLKTNLVLALSTIIFYLYARRRLMRPENLL